MSFIAGMTPPSEDNEPAWWFAFQNDQLLVSVTENSATVPRLTNLKELKLLTVRQQFLGKLNGVNCYSAELPLDALWPKDMSFMRLLQLFSLMDENMMKAALYAVQIVRWDQTHQFCGRCQTKTETKDGERAKICPSCKLIVFPRLSPAIMAAIVKDDKLLMANGQSFPPSFFSVLAGFVEPGETLEECVAREVKEEVGLIVDNIRYFNSQPWPFPDSLMIGFFADYAGGEILVDGVEIKKADWFTIEEMPRRPDAKISLAGKMIDWFEKNLGKV